MKLFFTVLLTIAFQAQLLSEEAPLFKIGVFADCQYCNKVSKGARLYNTSDARLKTCVKHYNQENLKFVIQLGDLIDAKIESYKPILTILDTLKHPMYHVLGNHEFSVKDDEKHKIPEILKLKSRYYSFKVQKWNFIALDGNDVSFHAYPKESPKHQAAKKYYKDNNIKSPSWNGALGETQMNWLKSELKRIQKDGEKAILFCHFPIYPANSHNLWNSKEVLETVMKFDCVKAYINGHNHAGNYAQKGNTHFLTLKGMVQNAESTYSIISFFNDKLEVKGLGKEPSRTLNFSAKKE